MSPLERFSYFKVVCDICSSNRAPLEYKKHHAERVCDPCYEKLYESFKEQFSEKYDSSPDAENNYNDEEEIAIAGEKDKKAEAYKLYLKGDFFHSKAADETNKLAYQYFQEHIIQNTT